MRPRTYFPVTRQGIALCLCVARALDYPLNSAYTSPYKLKALDRKLINTSEIGTDTEMEIMEWRKCYMDVILVPLGVLINIAYHAWLWHKVRTQPLTTAIGTYTEAQRLWVPAIMKDIEKRNIVAVQTLRNTIMGSTLMATTSIILCAGLADVISSTYGVTKTTFDDTVYGGQGEFMVAVKRATLLITFLLSFFSHSMSLTFLNQVNILISTLEDPKSIVTPEYVSHLLEKGCGLSTAGNRIFYLAIPLLLWFFGPLLAFLCFLTMVPLLYNHDFLYQSV